MPKNQIWLPIAIVLGLLIGGFSAYIYKSVSRVPAQTTVASTGSGVNKVKAPGEVLAYVSDTIGSVTRISGSNTSKIGKGETLRVGDTLRTDTGASIEIIYSDSSIVRISEGSSYELRTRDTGYLGAGSLWARIIRPVTELGIFTVETSDLSAGVRGTAVLLTTSASGSECTVVDSSLPKDSVSVRATTGSGVIETSLSPEESISTFDQREAKKIKVNMQRLLAKREVIQNLKKDILYLTSLEGPRTWVPPEMSMQPIDPATQKKINTEVRVSLPSTSELQKFFESKAVELEYTQMYGSISGIIEPEDTVRIRILFGEDLQLTAMKKTLENLRSQSIAGADETKKDAFQKSVNILQEGISGFDKTFGKAYEDRVKSAMQAVSQSATVIEQWVEIESSWSASTGSLAPINTLSGVTPSLKVSTPSESSILPTLKTSEVLLPSIKPVVSGPAVIVPKRPPVSGQAIIR